MGSKKRKTEEQIVLILIAVLLVGCTWYLGWGRDMLAAQEDNEVKIITSVGQQVIYAKLTSVKGNEITYTVAEAQEERASDQQAQGQQSEDQQTQSKQAENQQAGDRQVPGQQPEGEVGSRDQASEGQSEAGDRPGSGEMPGGGMSGGEMSQGGMPGGEIPGGGMSGGEMSQGGMPGGEIPGGGMFGGEMPEGGMPSGEMPGGKASEGGMPNEGEIPQREAADSAGISKDESSEQSATSDSESGQSGRPDMSSMFGGSFGQGTLISQTAEDGFTYNGVTYLLTEESVTAQIPVGTDVTTRLGTITTFSRLAAGDQVALVVEEDQGQQIIMAVYIIGS